MSISAALKARRSILVGIAILFLAVIGFRKLGSMGQTRPVSSSFRQINVLTQEVKVENIPVTISLSGKLTARNRIDLFSEVNGILQTTKFREGNTFSKGELIASLDDSELRNSILSQKSNLLNAVSQILPDLQLDYPEAFDRWVAFHRDIQFDAPIPDLPEVRNDKLKVFLSARNIYSSYFSIKSQEARLSKYQIRAPFNGTLSSADITPGALVRAGQKLGTFIEPGTYELEASAGIDDLRYINTGDKVDLKSNELSGNWKGVVLRINRSLDAATQTVKVYIGVSGNELKEGQYMVARVDGVTLSNVCAIPRLLLLPNEKIYIVESDSILKTKSLEIVYRGMDNVYASNLQNGEVYLNQVINNGYEGMIVRRISGKKQ